ncbi:MAG TPA: sigma-70 family RNA polymerase sigma factor [Chitinophagaceae bacterium]|jgi:RNA polymerase sigma factor (sigma-70 family)|nr:sigma-70 family RNA polymerase sigma factor [Chitinophagaceae bacterium]
MTDSEILRHLESNHYAKALNGLYGMLPSVKKYIITNNGSAEDVKDIFQDALVVLYKKACDGDYVLYGSLKTYVLTIVKNLWLQELRRRKKIPAGEADADIADVVVPEEEPGFFNAKTAFNLLGEKCRQLLILFYFKKKSFREIATELAFSDERVAKNQKYRCMEKAKENYRTLTKTGNHGK